MTPDGSKVYIADYEAGYVSVIDHRQSVNADRNIGLAAIRAHRHPEGGAAVVDRIGHGIRRGVAVAMASRDGEPSSARNGMPYGRPMTAAFLLVVGPFVPRRRKTIGWSNSECISTR